LKRFRPGGRGMVKPYAHKFSHIIVTLEPVKRSVKKSDVKAEPVEKEEKVKEVKKLEEPKEKKEVKKTAKPTPKKVEKEVAEEKEAK
jgi:hypothetical protein